MVCIEPHFIIFFYNNCFYVRIQMVLRTVGHRNSKWDSQFQIVQINLTICCMCNACIRIRRYNYYLKKMKKWGSIHTIEQLLLF